MANRKKHRSTCAAKRPSRRLPGTVTRLKYNCANFHYFLISTEQQCPPPFFPFTEKYTVAGPINHTDFRYQTVIHSWHTRVCVCLCIHQLCFCLYIFVVLAWCINTLHMGEKIRCIFTSISPRTTFVRVTVFFSSKNSNAMEEKQNYRLQVSITGRFLEYITLQLSNI